MVSSKVRASKKNLNVLVIVVLATLYAATYLVYLFNRIDPMIGGMSFTLFYGITLYIIMVIVVTVAAKFVWGD